MALTQYEKKKNFRPARLEMIDRANEVCEEYAEAGMVLTLRQLYYRFVSRNWIENKQSEYDRLGELCRDARMQGLMDWDHLIDRTRNLQTFLTYKSPQDAMKRLAKQYHRDLWAPQKKRIEVWVEKDAAIGVVEGVCKANSVPFFSCRGYTSMSEMHDAAQRLRWHMEQGNQVKILHIGDHDPSGVDMTRDIEDRLRSFIHVDWRGLNGGEYPPESGRFYNRGDFYDSMRQMMRDHGSEIEDSQPPWSLKRIALNMDQVLQYDPPPNPVKKTDGRWRKYYEDFGVEDSWELDALEPSVLQDLILKEIDAVRNDETWDTSEAEMERERRVIKGIEGWWDEVDQFVQNAGEHPKTDEENDDE